MYGPYFGKLMKHDEVEWTLNLYYLSIVRIFFPTFHSKLLIPTAEMANNTDIGFSCAFSVFVSMALEGLFHLRMGMEDPFSPLSQSADAVDVDRELEDLVCDIKIFYDDPTEDKPTSKTVFEGQQAVVGIQVGSRQDSEG